VGDLGLDTSVEPVGEGSYAATLSREWEIWGPMGGYVASVALRAAGEATPFARPASFSCHYLGVADFGPVEMAVTTLRSARTAQSQRVELTQAGKPILEATVWTVGDVEGLEHDLVEPPALPGPDDLPSITELLDPDELQAGPPFPFWTNLESKPLRFQKQWPPSEPLPPRWQTWCRFTPTPTFEDPWVDACRALILIDVQSWPAASLPHAWREAPFIAPSLDLYVAFHDPQPASDWLLADGSGPIARAGLMGWHGRLWTAGGHLVASGQGQLLCRRVRP
jgi:acyl-CoA thioesterase-2